MLGYSVDYVSALALLTASPLKHNPRLEVRRENVNVAAALGIPWSCCRGAL